MNKPLSCPTCGQEFSRSDCLKRHVDRHSCQKPRKQQKPRIYTPTQTRYKSNDGRWVTVIKRLEDKGWPCPNCRKTMGRVDTLKRHLTTRACSSRDGSRFFLRIRIPAQLQDAV